MKLFKRQALAARTTSHLIPQLKYRLNGICGLLLLALLACLIIGLTALNKQEELGHQSEWLHQGINDVLTAMINEETGVRGYLTTNDVIFLEPFHLGEQQYQASLFPLQQYLLQKDFPQERLALARVNEKAQVWYKTFALPQIQIAQTGDYTVGRSDKTARQGKALFDAFRRSTDQFQEVLDADVLARRTQAQFPIGSVFLGAAVFAVTIYVLFCWTVMHFSRDLHYQFEALKHTARQWEAQHLTARVEPLKHEELNLIGQTFNAMAEALQRHQQNLDRMVENLARHGRDLEQAHSESRAILDATNEAMLLLAPDGQVLSINRRFCELFPQASESPLHQSLNTLRSWWLSLFMEPEFVSHWLEQNLASRERSSAVTLFQSAQVRRELEVYSTPVHSTKTAYLGQLYVLRDVTYENELERMKQDFVAQVSHELRTPLTSVKGFVELLLEEPDGLSEEQQEYLRIVQENAQRLVALVNDLLDLSRIESGKMELECAPVPLNPLIRNVLQSFRPQVSSKQQRIETQLVEPSPVVSADPARLQQIISNLVSNAHKYTLTGGTICITTRIKDQEVRVAIQDNGVGMTHEEQAKLFTKFFRAKNRQTEDVGGTGLGLAITLSLVQLHGGTMYVESRPGQGSTFHFTLPLAPEELQPTLVKSSLAGVMR